MSLEEFAVCFAITLVAATVHGSAGLGSALIAAPVLALVDTSLVPGPLIVAGLVLSVLMVAREHESTDLKGVWWAVLGCAVGCSAAIPVIRLLSASGFAVVFAGLLLIAVALSAAGFHIGPSPRANVGAGFAAGFMATISSVGGPPIALVYQHEPGPRLRSTLALFFTVGGLLNVAALLVAGRMGAGEMTLAGYLCPGLVSGYFVSTHTRRFLDGRMLRPVVLTLASAAAVAVVVKALV